MGYEAMVLSLSVFGYFIHKRPGPLFGFFKYSHPTVNREIYSPELYNLGAKMTESANFNLTSNVFCKCFLNAALWHYQRNPAEQTRNPTVIFFSMFSKQATFLHQHVIRTDKPRTYLFLY